MINTNEFQTPITREWLDSFPDEVVEQFLSFVDKVPLIKYMIGPDRKRAKDLPRDDQGRIIVDITHPHILEDMDYFRPAALFYKENGCYTLLRPNSNPNSEYGRWFLEERRRCREGYVRESDGEWVTGLMYWYLNYCPIMLNRRSDKTGITKRVEDFPDFWEGIYYRYHYYDQARKNGKHCLELARRGAHPYFEKVFTPDGWKEWKDIKIGDKLFGTDGKITNVIDIPYDRIAPYYKITLRDGRTVFASDDHKWVIWEGHKKYAQILTTSKLSEIYAKKRKVSERVPSGIEYNCFIAANKGVELPEKETAVDPYTFGFLLGDGCFRHLCCYVTQDEKDLEEVRSSIPYNITKWNTDNYSYRIQIDNWRKILRDYDLIDAKSEDKFIPDEYKYNSRAVRLNILRGLFDTDGHVHGGVPTFTTVSERLKSDIMEVARSLGYNSSYTKQKAGYKKDGVYIECQPVYLVAVYAGKEIFTISRKKNKVHYISGNALSRKNKTSIVNIEYIGETKCKCVTVDSDDNCYLIGDFIATHNCSKSYTLASVMAHNLILGENEEVKRRVTTILTAYLREYLAEKDGTLSKFTPMIDFVAQHTEFPRLMYKRSQAEMTWIMGYKNKNGNIKGSLNSVLGLSVKDDEGKIRGKRGFILFEEMGNFSRFREVWDNVRDSVMEGDNVFSLLIAVGTAGDKESDFSGVKTILYNPKSYGVYALDNVYDEKGKGTDKFSYFFPSYISRAGCMDKDGNSDVTKALMQILMQRYEVKHGGDPASLLSRIAQMPITPAEAILKVKSNYFPVVMLNERARQLDQDPRAYDDVYVGMLADVGGHVEFRATDDAAIRSWPVDNTEQGAQKFRELCKDNAWLASKKGTYDQMVHPEVREAYQQEMNVLVDCIYKQNQPKKHTFLLKKIGS